MPSNFHVLVTLFVLLLTAPCTLAMTDLLLSEPALPQSPLKPPPNPNKPNKHSDYLAPLQPCTESRLEPRPGRYMVQLRPGRTLQQHSEAVGMDMAPHVDMVFKFIIDRAYYVGQGVEESLLERIRRDEGVLKVEQDCWGELE
ncbi:MAG: hypothetical protein Q9227_009112 [Pyrenula ochraceoflavens]